MRIPLAPLLVALTLGGCASSAPRGESASSAAPDVFATLAGSWTGVLEYSDYRSERRVQLPTRVAMRADEASRVLSLAYEYREPNGEAVTSRSMHGIDVAAGRYVMGSDTFAIGVLEGFDARGGGRMVLTGTVIDNDRPEPARHTFTLAGDTLRILKETRSPLRFRNEYRLVRDRP